jgi:hypothetical protein
VFKRISTKVAPAVRAAAQDAADEIKQATKDDVQGAGRFGSRWFPDAMVRTGGGNVRIDVTEQVPYWRIFQHGGTISGRPLLWIPLGVAGNDAAGVSAKDYGPLFRVDRGGGKAPLLLAPGRPAQVKYFGKTSVYEPKKFHIIEIVRETAKRMADFFRANFEGR